MDNLVNGVSRRMRQWVSKHHVLLVVLLSAIHIGLAFIHARDSGTTDS